MKIRLALIALSALAPLDVVRAAPAPIEGRWDLVVQSTEGPKPSWFEVRHSGFSTFVGQFVGIVGSARPISRVTWENGVFRFSIPPQWEREAGDWTIEGRLMGDSLSGTMRRPDGGTMAFTGRRAPTLRRTMAPVWGPPVALFNGRDLSGWKPIQGENHWSVVNGVLANAKGGANLATERTFTDFQLTAEVRFPKGGNSGVYLRGRYEVQVEDSPGPEPAIDGLGAIYGFITPNQYVNRGAGVWHRFEVTLIGRTVTVMIDGKTVISLQEIPGPTGGALDSDEGAPGPLFLQGDHGPVEYRNIRIRSTGGTGGTGM